MYLALPKASRRGAGYLLEKAKVDFEKALDLHASLDEEIDLAQALHLLKHFHDAIELFQSVVDRLDGQKCVMVHNKMGYCLMQGPFSSRRAVESFKRAMECESGTFLKATNSQHMLRMLLQMCSDQSNPKHLIEEVRFWLEEAQAKYSDISHIVKFNCEHYGPQMLEVCKSMQAKGRHQLASQHLSCLQTVSSPGRCEEISQLLAATNIAGANVASSDSEISPGLHSILPSLSQTRNKKGKKYDCFIWHSAEGRDAEWVYYSLLPRLEDCHRYKCCVPLRDIQSASSVMELPSNVDEAACVIVILTSTLCRDEICQELVNTLVSDSVYTVLPVTLDDNFIPVSLRSPKVIPYYSWELLLQALEKACMI